MNITIGKYDAATGQVTVTFISGEREHRRQVNAVRKPDGGYDRVATALRVDEVALGVQAKMDAGVFDIAPAGDAAG